MPDIQVSRRNAPDELAILEALARVGYDAAHPSDSFDDLKVRRRFSQEVAGLYLDWMQAARAGIRGAAPTGEPAEKEISSCAAAA